MSCRLHRLATALLLCQYGIPMTSELLYCFVISIGHEFCFVPVQLLPHSKTPYHRANAFGRYLSLQGMHTMKKNTYCFAYKNIFVFLNFLIKLKTSVRCSCRVHTKAKCNKGAKKLYSNRIPCELFRLSTEKLPQIRHVHARLY